MTATVLDINAATVEQIDVVPALRGHGYEIVRYRGERGRFTSLRQLDEVPGLAAALTPDDLAILTVGPSDREASRC